MNVCLLTLKRGSQKGLGMAAWAEDAPARQRRTRLAVIWHTVKDPRNLHSDCVPVGWAELCPSLAAHGSHPEAGLRAAEGAGGEGGWSESSLWQAAISPSPQHTAAYTQTCLHTEVSPPLSLCAENCRGICFYSDSVLTERASAFMWKCRP